MPPLSESLHDIHLFVATYEERSFTAAGGASTRRSPACPSISESWKIASARGCFRVIAAGAVPTPAGDTLLPPLRSSCCVPHQQAAARFRHYAMGAHRGVSRSA